MAKVRILKQNMEQLPKVIFTSKSIKQLGTFMSSAHAQTKEFLFLGYVTREDKTFTIEEFFLVPQEKCSATYCETDDARYPNWIAHNIPIQKRKNLRIHGHSHVNMLTSPSGTDDAQLIRLTDEVDDYFIQLIINHSMNYKVNIWMKQENIVIEDPELLVKVNNVILPFSQCLYPKISDGKYIVKNNIITFSKGLKLNLTEDKLYIEDEFMEYVLKKTTAKETLKPKISEEDKKEINTQMISLVKTPYVYNDTITYPNCYQKKEEKYYQKKVEKQNQESSLLDYIEDDADDFYGSEYGEYYGLK